MKTEESSEVFGTETMDTGFLSEPDVSITLGSEVEPGGDISAAAQTEEFAPGDPVIAAVPIGRPAGIVQMRWIGPDGSTVAEELLETVPVDRIT